MFKKKNNHIKKVAVIWQTSKPQGQQSVTDFMF